MINDRNKPLRIGSKIYSVYPTFENDTVVYKTRKYEIVDMFYSDELYIRATDDRGVRHEFTTRDLLDFYYTSEEAEWTRKKNERTTGYAYGNGSRATTRWAGDYQDYEKAEED